jgi:hypothetical protein
LFPCPFISVPPLISFPSVVSPLLILFICRCASPRSTQGLKRARC